LQGIARRKKAGWPGERGSGERSLGGTVSNERGMLAKGRVEERFADGKEAAVA